jgi:Integrase core domain
MFDRICRENGVIHRLTKPRSPTTTGKIERFQLSLETELLDECEPSETVVEGQVIVDGRVVWYNTDRPHQSLDLDFPADRFRPRPIDELGLRLPPALFGPRPITSTAANPAPSAPTARSAVVAAVPVVLSRNGADPVNLAVEIERMVPASGNLTVCGQQFWFGPQLGYVAITLWMDTTVVQLLRDGVGLKTVPSRLTAAQLRQLLADGGRIAGPPPVKGAGTVAGPVEVDRLVNACGTVGLASTPRATSDLTKSITGREARDNQS